MSDTLKEFIVSYGFAIDDSSKARAEAAIAASEKRITAANSAEAEKRLDTDRQAGSARVDAAQETSKRLITEEQRAHAAIDRTRRDSDERTRKRDDAETKRVREQRATAFKEAEQHLLRFSSVATSLGAGLGAFIKAAPMGAFLADVTKTAEGLAAVATQARAIGTTPTALLRERYAMGQAGVSQGDADSALSGFADKFRQSPDLMRKYLAGLGVKTTDKDGKDLDVEGLFENTREHWKSMPLNYASSQASFLGINQNALQGIMDPNFERGLKDYDSKIQKFGLDPDKASKEAREFENAYNSLAADLEIIKTRIEEQFFGPLTIGFKAVSDWFEAHPNMAVGVGDGLVAFGALMSARAIPPIISLTARLTGLSDALSGLMRVFALAPAGLLAAVGLAVTPSGANAGEPTIDSQGNSHFPDGHVVPAKKWDGKETAKPYEPKDDRSWWERTMPKILGGKDPATANKDTVDVPVRNAIINTEKAVVALKDLVAEQAQAAEADGAGGGGGAMGAARRFFGAASAASGGSYGGGGSASRPAKGALAANQKIAYATAKAEGLSDKAARAVVADLSGEGLAVPTDLHWDGTHNSGGIASWDPQRAEAIRQKFGDVPWKLSVADQTKAFIWEYRNNPRFAPTRQALEGDDVGEMMHQLVHNDEVSANQSADINKRLGFYRGFNPNDAATASATAATNSSVKRYLTWASKGAKVSNPDGDDSLTTVDRRDPKFATASRLSPAQEALRKAMENPDVIKLPTLSRPLGDTATLRSQIDNSKTHNFNRAGDTFNIHGADQQQNFDSAQKLSANRDNADKLRYMQGSTQ